MGRPKNKIGRPTIYSEKLADEICRRLASGESLNGICKDPGMPDESTVRQWSLDNHNGFYPKYARAREIQADVFADQIIAIADDCDRDYAETPDGTIPNHELVKRSALRVDARKWLVSKILPKKYGDRQTIEHKNAVPVQVVVSREEVAAAVDELDSLKG
jgi:hypothetical protein